MWAASLTGITQEQIEAALTKLGLSGASWPPSAPEFRAMCENKTTDSWEHKSDAYREFRPERLLTKETQADRLKVTPRHEAFLKENDRFLKN